MKIMNHGLQILCQKFPKKLHPNATMSTAEGSIFLVLYLVLLILSNMAPLKECQAVDNNGQFNQPLICLVDYR